MDCEHAAEGAGRPGDEDQRVRQGNQDGDARRGRKRAGLGSAWRIGLSLLPAAAVTGGLFIAMDRMIATEEVILAEVEKRPLEAIRPTRPDTIEPRVRDRRPERLESASPPPPPPAYTVGAGDIDLPVVTLAGQVPELAPARLGPIDPGNPVIAAREARPLSPPQPVYPRPAAERGLEGSCEVRFSVSIRGEPFEIEATCTDRVFARAAEQAVARVRFAPLVRRGEPLVQRNVVYPIRFELAK